MCLVLEGARQCPLDIWELHRPEFKLLRSIIEMTCLTDYGTVQEEKRTTATETIQPTHERDSQQLHLNFGRYNLIWEIALAGFRDSVTLSSKQYTSSRNPSCFCLLSLLGLDNGLAILGAVGGSWCKMISSLW